MGNKVFMIDQTTKLVSPLPLLLLCGKSLTIGPFGSGHDDDDDDDDDGDGDDDDDDDGNDERKSILTLDDWLDFKCDAPTACMIIILRKRLQAAFSSVVANPAMGLSTLSASEKDALNILPIVV